METIVSTAIDDAKCPALPSGISHLHLLTHYLFVIFLFDSVEIFDMKRHQIIISKLHQHLNTNSYDNNALFDIKVI